MVLKIIAGRGYRKPSEKDKIQETSAKNQRRGYSLAFYFAYIISVVLNGVLDTYAFFPVSSSCSLSFWPLCLIYILSLQCLLFLHTSHWVGSIILSFPSFLKIFSISPPTGFPPCWELRILRNVRLSIVFSFGELLHSVDDDDENDSLSYRYGGMKSLQLGI